MCFIIIIFFEIVAPVTSFNDESQSRLSVSSLLSSLVSDDEESNYFKDDLQISFSVSLLLLLRANYFSRRVVCRAQLSLLSLLLFTELISMSFFIVVTIVIVDMIKINNKGQRKRNCYHFIYQTHNEIL